MDSENNLNSLKPLTFQLTFRIAKADYDYNLIRLDLINSLISHPAYYRFERFAKYENDRNVIYFVLNDLFKRRFSFTGNTNGYLTDYREVNGSLIISFTALIVGAVTNYGSIRETIDYFVNDVEWLFDSSLNSQSSGYMITSNIEHHNNQSAFPQIEQAQLSTSQYPSLLKAIKVNRILIGIVFFVLMLSLIQNYLLSVENSELIDKKEVKVMIQDELRNQKIDELLKLNADTTL